jgi:hypothetical protein
MLLSVPLAFSQKRYLLFLMRATRHANFMLDFIILIRFGEEYKEFRDIHDERKSFWYQKLI